MVGARTTRGSGETERKSHDREVGRIGRHTHDQEVGRVGKMRTTRRSSETETRTTKRSGETEKRCGSTKLVLAVTGS